MKKLIETLRSFGVEIPAEKEAEIKAEISKNYKNVAEVTKTTEKLETERDSWKGRAETAESTLKNFEGIDPANVKDEIATWKKKAEDAERDFQKKLDERDFEDALKEEIGAIKFSSEAAKKAVLADIRAAGLKVKNGKILGLSDLIEQMKSEDASAFVSEQQTNLEQGKARFTQNLNNSGQGTVLTKKDIMAIKDPAERQAKIAANIDLFKKG